MFSTFVRTAVVQFHYSNPIRATPETVLTVYHQDYYGSQWGQRLCLPVFSVPFSSYRLDIFLTVVPGNNRNQDMEGLP